MSHHSTWTTLLLPLGAVAIILVFLYASLKIGVYNTLKDIFVVTSAKKTPTRLSPTDAIAIACVTGIAKDHKDQMTLVTCLEQDNRPVWVVSSATIGSMIEVVIDDETGAVIKAGRVGLR